jgi:hypothetical protein
LDCPETKKRQHGVILQALCYATKLHLRINNNNVEKYELAIVWKDEYGVTVFRTDEKKET